MYQSSSSSSSSQNPTAPPGLTRYGSAPGSFLNTAVDAVIGTANNDFSTPGSPMNLVGHYFSRDTSTTKQESSVCKVSSSNDPKDSGKSLPNRSYGFNDIAQSSGGGSSSLVRQRSSPAGFFSNLSSDNGFSLTRGTVNYNAQGCSNGGSRLKSQLSFTGQDSLSQISEVSENGISGNSHQNATHSYANNGGFGVDSWDNSHNIHFGKRSKNIDGDFFTSLNTLETQFSMPQTSLEMARMETLMNIPEDSVPCKIRAKRGFATHPRSIAERERRTRISGKLKKLQELVPNMDKQTSYADMLELAVQHIRGLQSHVQKLHKDLENCTCGCKQPS